MLRRVGDDDLADMIILLGRDASLATGVNGSLTH